VYVGFHDVRKKPVGPTRNLRTRESGKPGRFGILDTRSGMSELEEIEKVIARLSRAERATLLAHLAQDVAGAFPGIESTPDICGGEARLVRTRIPVWLLVRARELGSSEADLLRAYPSLRADDLTHAWRYARLHPEEIRDAIRRNEE